MDLRFDRLFKKRQCLSKSNMEEDRGKDNETVVNSFKADPDYDIFLKNWKPIGIGKSIVNLPSSSGCWIEVRYCEGDKEPFYNVERNRNLVSNSKRVKVPQKLDGFLGKEKTETPKTVKKSREIGNGGSKYKSREVPSEQLSKKKNCDMVDRSYLKFLESHRASFESDQRSIHQKNDGSSDLEILEPDNIPSHEGDYTSFVPSKCYQSLPGEESWDGIRTCGQSQFRDKLMDLLQIPYNQKEFDNLWEEVTRKKPVERVRDLRHGIMKRYSTKTDGKSYLDWHKEFRMKVDEFRSDLPKLLYLLRGFFFWLKFNNGSSLAIFRQILPAAKWRYTKIHAYKKLYDLFGKDRAKGKGACFAKERCKQLEEKESEVNSIDIEKSCEPSSPISMSNCVIEQPKNSTKKAQIKNLLEKQIEVLENAIGDVAEVIRQGNAIGEKVAHITEKGLAIAEKGRPHCYSENEVFNELQSIEVPENCQLDAFLFLNRDQQNVRAFFGVPRHRRKELLLKMMLMICFGIMICFGK